MCKFLMNLRIELNNVDGDDGKEILCRTETSIIYRNNGKVTKKLTALDYSKTLDRVKVLIDFPHPNICKYHSVDYDKREIQMDYYKEDFFSVITTKEFSRERLYQFFKNMVEAVNHIHKLDIVHTDVKLDNFMVGGDELVLIDFEITHGTHFYASPDGYSSKKSDIWSLGVCFYAILFGEFPFTVANKKCKMYIEYEDKGYLEHFKYATEHEESILKNTLCVDKDKRWTIEQLMEGVISLK